MTEKEKMLLGEIYNANYDKELLEERVKAKDVPSNVVVAGNPCRIIKKYNT